MSRFRLPYFKPVSPAAEIECWTEAMKTTESFISSPEVENGYMAQWVNAQAFQTGGKLWLDLGHKWDAFSAISLLSMDNFSPVQIYFMIGNLFQSEKRET